MSANLRGSLFMVAAMMCFAVEDALYKQATATVSPGLALMFFGGMGAALYAALAARAGDAVLSRAMVQGAVLLRSGAELAARLLFALALAFTPLSSTSAILQASPLIVTLGAALVLGEVIGRRRWIAMAVGLVGVLLILRPSPEAFRVDALFALGATICFSARDLATRAAPPGMSRWQLGVSGFVSVFGAGLLIFLARAEALVMPPAPALGVLALTAVVGVTAYTLLTGAMRTGEIGVVAPFRYSRLLAALVLAMIFFGERPDAWTLCGAALIVGSGIYTLLRGRARNSVTAARRG